MERIHGQGRRHKQSKIIGSRGFPEKKTRAMTLLSRRSKPQNELSDFIESRYNKNDLLQIECTLAMIEIEANEPISAGWGSPLTPMSKRGSLTEVADRQGMGLTDSSSNLKPTENTFIFSNLDDQLATVDWSEVHCTIPCRKISEAQLQQEVSDTAINPMIGQKKIDGLRQALRLGAEAYLKELNDRLEAEIQGTIHDSKRSKDRLEMVKAVAQSMVIEASLIFHHDSIGKKKHSESSRTANLEEQFVSSYHLNDNARLQILKAIERHKSLGIEKLEHEMETQMASQLRRMNNYITERRTYWEKTTAEDVARVQDSKRQEATVVSQAGENVRQLQYTCEPNSILDDARKRFQAPKLFQSLLDKLNAASVDVLTILLQHSPAQVEYTRYAHTGSSGQPESSRQNVLNRDLSTYESLAESFSLASTAVPQTQANRTRALFEGRPNFTLQPNEAAAAAPSSVFDTMSKLRQISSAVESAVAQQKELRIFLDAEIATVGRMEIEKP